MTPIAIVNLTKRFGSTVAVDAVSLEVPAGDLFFLLGPSGCGKTTLLRMLAGFTDPTSGAIRFGGDEVTHLPPNRRNCGMVFQGYALWPHMTVAQNVAFGLSVRKVAKDETQRRVMEALRLVQMESLADRKPNQLSGGQQQRVALARALVIRPTVLLLDEPLSNLDAKLRLEMRSQIRAICKQAGTTAVYVTHDQKEALSMADRVAILRGGKVMQMGPPRELYDRPANRFVADFLGETNFLSAVIVGKENGQVVLECPAGRLRSSVLPADLPATGNVTCSIRPEAIRVADAADWTPEGLNVLPATRRDVVYLGEMAQHHLSIAGDVKVTAFELNPRPISGDAREAQITFDPSDVVILQD
jgi:iron(III) transport system ATP-binding protein